MNPSDEASTKTKLRKIEIQAKSRALDLFQGMYRSIFKGRGIEFEDLREYVVGDDIRAISWTKLAQTGRPFIKNFREERDLTVLLLVDVSRSQDFVSHYKTKREKAAEIAALLSFSAIANHDRVGLVLFTDRIEKYIPPKKGLKHSLSLIQELLAVQPEGRKTDLAGAFSFLYQITKKPVIAFVISDFEGADYTQPLMLAAKKDDVILIRVGDPEESMLPQLGLARFYEPEQGEEMILDVNEECRAAFTAQYQQFYRQFQETVKKCGVSAIELNTNSRDVPVLKAFFDARRRRRW